MLRLELLAMGANAHGYGRLPDGRDFAFRVRHHKARMEIYRPGADELEPAPEDIAMVANRQLGKVNLDSRRSLTVLLRGMALDAGFEQELPERTLRAYFGRLESIMDDWSVPEPPPPVAPGRHRRGWRAYLRRRFDSAA